MNKLVYTDNIGFDMRDWAREPIARVYAGVNCIMAVTSDGRTLQKTTDPSFATQTSNWSHIRQIAVSKWMPGLAIGLTGDGTCMVSKNVLRDLFRLHSGMYPSRRVLDEVKRWKNIIQVESSDSLFALDAYGRVHVSALDDFTDKDYRPEVERWSNVRRIVAGRQNSLLGITADGRVLCAGTSLRNGPRGDIAERAGALVGVRDAVPIGSECEEVLFAFQDGSVRDLYGEAVGVSAPAGAAPAKIFEGAANHDALMLDGEGGLVRCTWTRASPLFQGKGKVVSFAAGYHEYTDPFALAVVDSEGFGARMMKSILTRKARSR